MVTFSKQEQEWLSLPASKTDFVSLASQCLYHFGIRPKTRKQLLDIISKPAPDGYTYDLYLSQKNGMPDHVLCPF